MTGFDPDEWQDTVREPQPHDNVPVAVTYLQALKCSALVDAYVQGHLGYEDDVRMVALFWRAVAARTVHGPHMVMRPSVEDAWAQIDAAPWPLSGPPRPQPDA
ncbi:hypothetical protein [Cellulomonas marina]|uniref:Uncharacterized protein n=1 Tax=Cellulomonas marina TaxID=988821 RepID=A0A1I1AVE5_9CELL|nr:hypothetical protein [Cellulomonas marina]GIG29269.1 hypothetical protein Cma02nite_18690 [Cellulomonas marina]SFB40398.1 hypothetical protein SAMN05421867_12154 [Cellulomonas marina]